MKNKNFVISAIAILIIIGGLVWLAPGGKKNTTSTSTGEAGGAISAVGETSYDFGDISMAKGFVNHMFKIKNNSDKPAMVSQIYTSCMCTEATMTYGGRKFGPYGMPGHVSVPKVNQTIGPGEEAEIEAVFDPAAHGPAGVGKIDRGVYVRDGNGSQTEFKFSANVTP